MELYFSIFGISMAFAWLSLQLGSSSMGLRKRKKPQLLYYSISCVILVVFIGLREGVGTDFYSIYVAGFNEVIETGESRFEPGFTLLIHLCAWLTKDYHLFFFLSSALTIGLSYLAIYRFSENVLLSLFILLFGGFLSYSVNAIRQMIALAIILNAVGALRDRRVLIYAAYILVAATFHVSALLFLVVYPLVFVRCNYKKVVLGLGVIWLLGDYLLNASEPLVRLISPHLASYFLPGGPFSKVGDYDIANLVLCSMAFVLYIILGVNLKEKNDDYLGRAFLWVIVLGVLVCLLSGRLFILSRVAIYFSGFAVLYMPYAFANASNRKIAQKCLALYVALLILSFIYLYMYVGMNDLLPYQWITGASRMV